MSRFARWPRRGILTLAVLTAGAVPLLGGGAEAQVTASAVLENYANIAEAVFTDAYTGSLNLKKSVTAFLANPNPTTLAAARDAWKASRPAYMQTEGFRFGNAIVDDWEGRVNSWPLDEGLIDYVDTARYGEKSDENPLYTANVVANKTLRLGKTTLDARKIDPKLLDKLQEGMGVERNVAIGYHAVEFMLWGQDLNGTKPGAGNRPSTDYVLGAGCTHANCDRRRAYLTAAVDHLVADLKEMSDDWKKNGPARKQLAAKGEAGGLAALLTGIGSLSYGELGGERIKLGLLLHDPEEEHDCFSDNTQNSHYYDQVGMLGIWHGRYVRIDGSVVSGASMAEYTAAKSKDAADRLEAALNDTLARMKVMKDTADSGEMAYDQMLAAGNEKGNKILQDVVDGLVTQTRAVEGVVTALNLKISVQGSDALDNPTAVSN